MDRRELITGFIRDNLSLVVQSPFPAALYKDKKHDYFLNKHSDSKQGLPRDSEIASEVIWFLIRRGQVKNRKDLDLILKRGLLAEKVFDSEIYYEFLEVNKPSESLIDFKKLRETEFVDSIRVEIREELRKEMTIDRVTNIEQEIQRKMSEYESLPSVIDSQEFTEPATPPVPLDTEAYLPWWQQLHLKGDPFPMTEGLRRIDPNTYDMVVVKTPLFQKYLSYLELAPDEVFKNTIFFGEFGSGKTTLFEYLKRALSAANVYSIYVQLYSEKDLQSLKITFKGKLIDELKDILGMGLGDTYDVGTLDSTLRNLLNQLYTKFKPRGLIVFVDDLHKNKEDYPVSLEFLSYLQIFTSEIVRRISIQNVAFFVAGALEWEPIIRTQPRYSGSLARRESIQDITEEEAWTMLNRRLDAYYPNPEVKRMVDKEFVSGVYRDLKSNRLELTFRNFIQRLVDEFKIGNFRVLTSDPVHIPFDTLQKVRTGLEESLVLKERFRTLLEQRIHGEENRIICLRLLLDIDLKKKVKEQDFSDKLYYLQQLAKTRLITKAREETEDFSWVICPELKERAAVISANFSLSLEDYLLKIYAPSSSKRKGASEEIEALKSFIEKCDPERAKPLQQVLQLHSEIIDIQETYHLTSSEIEIADKCKKAIELLTDFYRANVEKPEGNEVLETGIRFWNGFWYSPGVVSQFQDLVSNEEECKRRIWYVMSIYRQAFGDLFSFISKEYLALTSIHISSFGLENEDVKFLVDARDLWTNGNSERCSLVLYNVMVPKLRMFTQNILTILYGDMPNRLKHINDKSRTVIQEAISNRPFVQGSPFHETNFLQFDDLVSVITDVNGTGGSHLWEHVFAEIFKPLTNQQLSEYFSSLAMSKERYRESDANIDASLDLREMILSTIDIARKMNMAYVNILENGMHLVMDEGTPKLYMSLDGLRDKSELIGLQFRQDILQALGSSLTSGPIRLNDQHVIQEYYSIQYREFFAYLALVLGPKTETLKISTKYKIQRAKGSTLFIKKVFSFSRDEPPRLFLCHSSKDNSFCLSLAADLKDNGLTVWFDEFEIKVGDSITGKINDALKENDYLGIVLSPNAVESEWVKKELSAALIRELDKKAVVILPILYKPCQVPPLIADKKYANFTANYQLGLEELLSRFAQ